MVDIDTLNRNKMVGLNREMVTEKLPRILRENDGITALDAVDDVVEHDLSDAPDGVDDVELRVWVAELVKRGLDVLHEAGYATRETNEHGNHVYRWAG